MALWLAEAVEALLSSCSIHSKTVLRLSSPRLNAHVHTLPLIYMPETTNLGLVVLLRRNPIHWIAHLYYINTSAEQEKRKIHECSPFAFAAVSPHGLSFEEED